MSAFADLLARWGAAAPAGSLLLNTDDPEIFPILDQGQPLRHCHFRRESDLQHNALGASPCAFPDGLETPAPAVFWAWPKARQEAVMMLDWLASHIELGGQLWLMGHNKGGIRSAPKTLSALGWQAHKVGSARHCVLLRATPPANPPPFSLENYWQPCPLPGGGTLWSLPGVFSHGRIDRGSQLLLPFLEHALDSPVLDFGCGAGLLSLAASTHHPGHRFIGVDNHQLALLSARRTAEENRLALETCWSDGLPRTDIACSSLITNPPFHAGLETRYDITYRLLRDGHQVLRPGARWLGVVNDHLPYGDWLKQYLRQVECLYQGDGFRVWSGRLPQG